MCFKLSDIFFPQSLQPCMLILFFFDCDIVESARFMPICFQAVCWKTPCTIFNFAGRFTAKCLMEQIVSLWNKFAR